MNKFILKFSAKSENESFARSVAGIFALQLNPSVSQISDIKTAVSEAVTNCIVHGYQGKEGEIEMQGYIDGTFLHINVFDFGVGIANVNDAMQPFYTTKQDEERSGMGFTIMKSFMDDVIVESKVGEGVKVYMTKNIATER